MPRTNSDEIVADGTPVLHTPQGAAPRRLRSDAFVDRPAVAPPAAVPGPQEFEERISVLRATGKRASAAPRDWDFAVPEPVRERPRDALVDPGGNWRQHAGLRAPVETAALPDSSRERFSENWQRLASEPLRERRSRVRRSLEKPELTRWMFSHGRFEWGAALGFLLLLALLIAAFVYGRRLLTGHNQKAAPPAEVHRVSTK